MFPFHERTQRSVCRIAFFALAILPLLAVCGWAIGKHLPIRHQATEDYFAQMLDADVSIQKIHYPSPTKTVLKKVQLLTHGSHHSVASIHQVSILEVSPEKTEMRITGLRLTSSNSQHFITSLQKAIQNPSQASNQSTDQKNSSNFMRYRVVLEDVTIRQDDIQTSSANSKKELHFDLIHIRSLLTETDEVQTQIAFRFAANASEHIQEEMTKAHLLAVIGWNTQGEMNSFSLKTSKHSVPCWLLSAFCPTVNKFGTKSHFQGNAIVDLSSKNTKCEIEGTIHEADFAELAKSLPLGTIQTIGELQFDQVQWIGNRIVSARGSLRCKSGRIDSKFIDAAVRALGCKRYTISRDDSASILPLQTDSNSPSIPFDELAFEFTLEEAGLTLRGLCRSQQLENSGTILANNGQALLGQPNYERIPVSNLVFFFIPQVQEYLLATREAQGIASWLPLPSVMQHRMANEATDTPETIRK